MIVAQVQAQTNLITQGAMDLAMNSGYDLASAAIRFEEVKVSVTSGAGFIRGTFANSARISFGSRIGSDSAGIVQAVSRRAETRRTRRPGMRPPSQNLSITQHAYRCIILAHRRAG
jgi:hypothetical protein